jgi:hypothetical protein
MDKITDSKQYRPDNNDGQQRADAKEDIKRIGRERSEHNEFAVRDIKDPPHAILKAESHGDQSVDTP